MWCWLEKLRSCEMKLSQSLGNMSGLEEADVSLVSPDHA